MIRVAISVEGQTEEAFVKKVLGPYLWSCDVYAIPILVQPRGGNVTLDRLANDMVRHYGNFDRVTSLVDFYGFRGKGEQTVDELETSIANAIAVQVHTNWNTSRVIPYVQMHEFEALLFADVARFSILIDVTTPIIEQLQAIRSLFESPEEIDDSPQTAPSKRLAALIPRYRKVTDGPDLAQEIGLEAIREACPRFDGWVRRLEGLNT